MHPAVAPPAAPQATRVRYQVVAMATALAMVTYLDRVCIAKLTPDNHPLAVGLAAIPEKIRGFGPVKARHLAVARADAATLLEQFRSGNPAVLKAAE